jgi:signal transduction histidine kinase
VDTAGEIRTISHALRPQLLSRFGLSSALRNLAEELNNATTMRWESRIDDLTGLLNPDDEINLYRIVQEGMNNSLRHAGATAGTLTVRHEDGFLQVTVSDNGKGFDVAATEGNGDGGFGLRSMRQRAGLLSASLEILSIPGQGTRIQLDVPVSNAHPDSAGTADVSNAHSDADAASDRITI